MPIGGVRRTLTVCGLAAPILFTIGVVFASSQYPGYSHLTQAISELGGVDAPSPQIQALNFCLAGILTIAFSIGLRTNTRLRTAAMCLGAFGLMMIAHGLLPCDAGCAFVTWAGTAHNLFGIPGFLAGITGVWLCGRQAPNGAYRAFSFASAGLALAGFVLWIALAKAAELPWANGSLQRGFVAVLLVWMFVTACRQLAAKGA